MQISIVTPIFNESKNIYSYCKAILALDYNLNDFELLIIDDGSTDDTIEIMKKLLINSKIKLKIIQLGKNFGRSVARITGARAAKNNNILFLDAKCEIFPDALKMIEKINYSPITCQILQRQDNALDLFFYTLRSSFYRKNSGIDFPAQYITTKNFDTFGKGTTMFFCTKALFLNSQPGNIDDRNNSDDTALLHNIVRQKAILTTPHIRCYYNTRNSFFENIKHIFNRGPKFIDYYYKPSKKHFWLINSTLIFIFLLIYRIYSGTISLYDTFLALMILDVLLTLYVSKSVKAFLAFLLFFPLFSGVFTMGIIKGIFLKLIGKF